jgi:homoserine dehydrogenase
VAFGARVVAGDVYREGISGITSLDIAVAHKLGYTVKLLAVVEHADAVGDEPEAVAVRVHPAMIPATHPLASVRDSFNAVFVEGDAVGQLMFLGRGAGGMPTASAVLGDLLDAAHDLTTGGLGRTVTLRRTAIRPIDDLRSAYYLTLDVVDRPGVLHVVSGVLGRHEVSIRLMEQEGLPVPHQYGSGSGSHAPHGAVEGAFGGDGTARARTAAEDSSARLVFVTHPSYERDVQACLGELRHLDVVHQIGGLLRVIGP